MTRSMCVWSMKRPTARTERCVFVHHMVRSFHVGTNVLFMATPVLPMVRMRLQAVSCLVVCLMATTTVSGCIDNPFTKGDEDDGSDEPLIGSDPIEGRTHGSFRAVVPSDEPEGPCDGCIGLSPPGTLPEARPPKVEEAPKPPEGPSLRIPEPRSGDVLLVDVDPKIAGHRHDSTHAAGSEDPGFRFVGTPDVRIVVDGSGHHAPGDIVADHARAAVLYATPITPERGRNPWADGDEGRTRIAESFTVSTYDRTLDSRGTVMLDPERDLLVDPGEARRVTTHSHDRATVPFGLGADLWGRDLAADGRFQVARRAPGHAAPVATFDYTVRTMFFDGSADVVVVAQDIHGGAASWRLTVSEASPYPLSVQRLWFGAPSLGDGYLPYDVERRTVALAERGPQAIAWSAPPSSTGSAIDRSVQEDTRYRVEEHLAPPVLNKRLPWGLGEAVDELFLRSVSFAGFMARHPDRLLVAASLRPEPAVDKAQTVGELVWTLTFADGTGGGRAWSLHRAMLEDDQVAPVTHHVSERAASSLPDRVRALRYSDVRDARLATGEHAYDSWADLGSSDLPNRVEYRIHPRPDGHLGGTLRFGHETPEVSYRLRPHDAGDLVATSVVQDLYVGDIVETVRAHAD